MGQVLQATKLYRLAINIFRHIYDVESIKNCYQAMIDETSNPETKLEWMNSYVKECLGYGQREQAIIMCQKMVKEFIFMPNQRKQAMKKLSELLQSS